MCISNTKRAREETQGWAAIYWRFTRPHETAHPFFYLICPRLKRMALCTGDGHLESSSNKSRCLKSRADRKHHIGESPCSGRRTSNLEIWECGGCSGRSRRLPWTFICVPSPLVRLVYRRRWARLQGRGGAFTEQPGVCKGASGCCKNCILENCCPNLKTQWRDFPGGPVVKNPPCNSEDTGSFPGRETEIPHATGQLSPHALQSMHCNERPCRPQTKAWHS